MIAGGIPAEQPKQEPSSNRVLTQEEIEKLISSETGTQPETPKPEPSSNRTLSQDEIEQLLQREMAAANPAPRSEPQPAVQQPAPGGHPAAAPEQMMHSVGMPPYYAGYPG